MLIIKCWEDFYIQIVNLREDIRITEILDINVWSRSKIWVQIACFGLFLYLFQILILFRKFIFTFAFTIIKQPWASIIIHVQIITEVRTFILSINLNFSSYLIIGS